MFNPQTVITPDAFRVAPELLGLPLSGAGRRLVAMLLDLVLVAILVSSGKVFLALAAAFVLFRVSRHLPGWAGQRRRWLFRAGTAVVLFVATIWVIDGIADRMQRGVAKFLDGGEAAAESGELALTGVGGVKTLAEFVRLERAQDSTAAAASAAQLLGALERQGLPAADAREVLGDMAEDTENAWVAAGIRGTLAPLDSVPVRADTAAAVDSFAVAFAQAHAAHDTAALAVLQPLLVGRLAADTLAALKTRIAKLQTRNNALSAEATELRDLGILTILRHIADELGIGFGWAGLYFTAFGTLGKGQTPGKRVAGIRVIRLDGEPMGWWASFERFGGYAASILTGLLGFAQIWWDRNRQALHDKISETVVVREAR